VDEITGILVEKVILVIGYLRCLFHENQLVDINDVIDEISMGYFFQLALVTGI